MKTIRANNVLEQYIDQLVKLEETYDPEIRETAEDKREMYANPTSILLLALDNDVVLGEMSGLAVS